MLQLELARTEAREDLQQDSQASRSQTLVLSTGQGQIAGCLPMIKLAQTRGLQESIEKNRR
jgi:altronate dehydratase